MRDVLAHEYFDVDLGEVWKTVREDIPELKKRLLSLMADVQQSEE